MTNYSQMQIQNFVNNPDKVRILMTIIPHLTRNEAHYDNPKTRKKPKVGDLVCEITSPVVCPWTIGFVHQLPEDEYGTWVIREIGTHRLCNYSNARFIPIGNLVFNKWDLFEGFRRKYFVSVHKAMLKFDMHYNYRLFDITFLNERQVIVSLRKTGTDDVYQFKLPWWRRITANQVYLQLLAEGFDKLPDWIGIKKSMYELTREDDEV